MSRQSLTQVARNVFRSARQAIASGRPTTRRRGRLPLAIESLENRELMHGLAAATVAADAYETDNTAARARTISTSGTAQTHSIHRGSDVDWVKFTLSQKSNVVIETNGASGDTEMRLYGRNSSTRLMEYDDDDGNGLFSRIERSGTAALDAGTYYVRVNEYGGNGTIGQYTISVRTQQPSSFLAVPGLPAIRRLVVRRGEESHQQRR